MLDYISAVYEGLKDEYRRWRDGPPPPQPKPAAVNPPAPAPKKMAPPSRSHPPARDALPPLKNWAHPVGDKSNPLVQLTNLAKATAGYFPVGRYGMWHGGVHFDGGTAGTLDQSYVRCLADGEVVAYRIASQTPITTYYTPEKKLVQAQFSVGFVLVRHHLQAPKLENSPDTPPSLIFYSLYMHLQDWQSYEMLPQTPRPVFWQANSYRVKADVADLGPLGVTVHAQPKAGSSVLRELERGQRVTIRGSKGYVELRSVDGAALATPGYVRIDALESTSGEYRVRQDALGQVKGQHLNVHAEAKAKSTVLATLPRGTQVVVSGEGEYRKLESVLAVEPTGPASDDFKSPKGYLRFSALEPVIAPQQLNVIVIPEQPFPIKAGALIGHIGPYQTDVGQPQYKLHLETFTAENLPKFLEASREWAKRLPERDKTWLKLAKGTSVVTAHQGSGPPSVLAAGTPSGNDLLVPRSLLDGLRAEDKRVVAGEKFNWYRLTGLLNDAAGKPLDGWVCEKVGVTPWVSPWHWDGYATIHDYGPLPDGLAHSLNLRGLLADADVERLRPRIDRWDQGPVQSRLYDIIDSNRDGKLAVDEIQTALGIPAKAQSIAQLVIEYESEWHYRQAKWDDLDEVLGHTSSTPLLNWMAEKQRILELKWWSDVSGRVGLPEGGRVYHLHPVWLQVAHKKMARINYAVMYAVKGPAYKDEQVVSYSHYNLPVDTADGRIAGNSRIHGDISNANQQKVIDLIVEVVKRYGLQKNDLAMILAICHVESGFNPDAAAGTTSAAGLGQFVDGTAKSYGVINDMQRFDAEIGADALVRHYLENKSMSSKKYSGRDLYEMIYAYHHDGPSLAYGGRQISRSEVMPKYDTYMRNIDDGVVE